MKKIFLLVFIFIKTCPEQFVYPLFEIEDYIMLTYQKSLDDVELWLCHKDSGSATKELSSMFVPSQVKPLPDGSGFSFLDRGKVRVKLFTRRAPRVIDILEPISSILSMEWISGDSFVFVGKYLSKYGVFLCTLNQDGSVETKILALSDKEHYLYPCVVEGFLFCVAQGGLDSYRIVKLPWNPVSFEDFDMKNFEANSLVFFSDPTCFLTMVDSYNGFFLQYSHNTDMESLKFRCFSFCSLNNACDIQEIFNFDIPQVFIIGNSEKRLHDSVLPFLPYFDLINKKCFFVDYDFLSESPILYKYCLSDKTLTKVLGGEGMFSPLAVDKEFLYAGKIYDNDNAAVDCFSKRGLTGYSIPLVKLSNQ